MILDHKNHVIVMDATSPKFKLDFLEVGGAIKTKFTDLGGRIKLVQVVQDKKNKSVYISLVNCPEEIWEQVTNEVKTWCALKHRVYLEEKRRKGAI